MPSPFVWFDNIGPARSETTKFMQDAFDWQPNDIGPMTFLTSPGEDKPFAATCDDMEGVSGWVPYLEVDDLEPAVEKAKAHGAKIIAENVEGPAGVATFVSDPGGATMAIWKRAAGM